MCFQTPFSLSFKVCLALRSVWLDMENCPFVLKKMWPSTCSLLPPGWPACWLSWKSNHLESDLHSRVSNSLWGCGRFWSYSAVFCLFRALFLFYLLCNVFFPVYWDLCYSSIFLTILYFLCADPTFRLWRDQQHNPWGPEKTGRWLCSNNDWHRCRTCQQSLPMCEEHWLKSSFYQSHCLLRCADTIDHGTHHH